LESGRSADDDIRAAGVRCAALNCSVTESTLPAEAAVESRNRTDARDVLATGTLAEVPPRTCWTAAQMFDASRRQADTVSVVLVALKTVNCAPMPFGLATTNPELASVMVAVAVAYPAALRLPAPCPSSPGPGRRWRRRWCLREDRCQRLFSECAAIANQNQASIADWTVRVTPPAGAGGLRVIDMGACKPLPMVAFETVMDPLPTTLKLLNEKPAAGIEALPVTVALTV